MENNEIYGKIKVYGKIIDLDKISTEELIKAKNILDQRIENLCEKYIELSTEG